MNNAISTEKRVAGTSGHCQEGRETEDVRLMLPDRLDELLRRHVGPEVDHLEARAL